MISIIIPLYNKEKYISNTIQSVLNQKCTNYELIVVDDGSTDSSASIVEEFKEDNNIRLLHKKNGGSASARNLGIKEAKGEWIMILDADDTLEENILEHFYFLLDNKGGFNFYCCNHYYLKDGIKKIYSNKYRTGKVRNSFYSWCIGEFMPVAGSCIIKRDLLIKYPFKVELKRYEDAESLFRIMREAKIYRSPLPAMSYNLNSNSASGARKDISEDYIGHLNPNVKGWWEHYAIYKLYIQGCYLYPEDMKRLYKHNDFWTWRVRLMNRYLKIMEMFNLL